MNENLNRLSYFVAIAEEGTITAAAKRLSVSKAVVSKQLQLLEQDLGATLVLRSSRKLKLTELGNEFYEGARASVAQAHEACRLIRQRDGRLSGSLRVSAPIDFGNMYVAPLAANFSIDHPTVEIELLFSDALLNPIEEKFDIAYRIGWPEDSSNIARKLGGFRLLLVASPKLFERYAAPKTLEDLSQLPFIAHSIFKKPDKWVLNDTSSNMQKPVTFNRTMSADTKHAVLAVLLEGAGAAVMPDFLITSELAQGSLVSLLPQYTFEPGGIYSMFPPVPYRSEAAKEFSKTFREYFLAHK